MTPRDERSIAEIRKELGLASGIRLARLVEMLKDDDRAGVGDAVASALRHEEEVKREKRRLTKLYRLESELRQQGYQLVAGVDEVGRGALAGPLTAGACILPASPRISGLNDSKQLTPERREELAATIQECALCCSVAHVSPGDLDSLGMTAALRRAMTQAIDDLSAAVDHVVVDGRPMGVHRNETAVVGGDASVAAISAASIIAKVTRDALMREMATVYPEYGFEVNKGYGTREHMSAIDVHGLCPLHRRSFAPCADMDRLF